MTQPSPHDAQRELERHALRNVRGLVDKMDAIEQSDRGVQKRLLVGIVVGALVLVGVILGSVAHLSKDSGHAIVVEPAKASPAK